MKTLMKTLVILLAIFTFGYMAPFAVAYCREQKDTSAIFVLNLFLGWTFLGWIIALIWAVKN